MDEKKITFERIAKRMSEGELIESEIDAYRRYAAAWLFYLNEQSGKLSATSAFWLTEHRSEYKSQAEAERAWEATKEGQTLIKTKARIKGIEALTDALAGTWFLRQREWKETHGLGS